MLMLLFYLQVSLNSCLIFVVVVVCYFWLFISSCLDIEPPVFNSCPINIHKYASKNKTATVRWTTPNATDNSGILPNITLLSFSGHQVTFEEGRHQVIYLAVDEAKNRAVCSFTVDVEGTLL